ncbi:GNAT family N-acetyltransferase [Allorhizocola rhizosphaerae]|uniref:GNAT family N-acetyltransferase n=1 Tax=Allorhizocola rhizosphaerae TaxID=1872709 RepID=UPI000E3D588C|nr:GNAT family N-acetyltransferase [Allorhizocola rhizosphaerae]
MPSITARQALPSDASELVRLRGVMLASIHGGDPSTPGAWRTMAVETLHKRLSDHDPTMAAFVVDRPGNTGLAACAVGVIETRLGGPDNPSGTVGYVFNVVTDEDQRRQGFSRACMQALLAWFADHGVTRIDLAASTEGEPLYHELGFRRTTSPRMQLKPRPNP